MNHSGSNLGFNFVLDGQVYFVRANSIGSDFGFPRLGIKKRYKW